MRGQRAMCVSAYSASAEQSGHSFSPRVPCSLWQYEAIMYETTLRSRERRSSTCSLVATLPMALFLHRSKRHALYFAVSANTNRAKGAPSFLPPPNPDGPRLQGEGSPPVPKACEARLRNGRGALAGGTERPFCYNVGLKIPRTKKAGPHDQSCLFRCRWNAA